MRSKHVKRDHLRALIGDVSPYEVPLPFSTRGLYAFLKHIQFKWTGERSFSVSRKRMTAGLEKYLRIVFDNKLIKEPSLSGSQNLVVYKIENRWPRVTSPYTYTLSRTDRAPRYLSVPHPMSMLAIARTIHDHSASIQYHSSRSPFSIRFPAFVAPQVLANPVSGDRADRVDDFAEQYNLAYDRLSTYFAYRPFTNINRFYDSKLFRACERKYSHLTRLDVANCFDSIYTHSIEWATDGHWSSKNEVAAGGGRVSFGASIDKCMQSTNSAETNGLPIGPEFSRIFAEIVLQHVDAAIYRDLEAGGLVRGRDYDIFRYVDDYFIFTHREDSGSRAKRIVGERLRPFKLNLNERKATIEKIPLRSSVALAKEELRSSMDSSVKMVELYDGHTAQTFDSRSFIMGVKRGLTFEDVHPRDISNYALQRLARVAQNAIRHCSDAIHGLERKESAKREVLRDRLLGTLWELLDSSFYIYSSSPGMSHAMKLCRIVVEASDGLKSVGLDSTRLKRFRTHFGNELYVQFRSQASKGEFDVSALALLDCMHHLKARLTGAQWGEVLEASEKSLLACDPFAILVLMRLAVQPRAPKGSRRRVIEAARKTVRSGKTDVAFQTQRAILMLSVPYCARLSTEEVMHALDMSKHDVVDLRGARDVFSLFNWDVDSTYLDDLVRKVVIAVY